MGRNIYGTNLINSNVSLNYVSCYITKAERGYRNDFPHPKPINGADKYSFVGYFHTYFGQAVIKTVNATFNVKADQILFVRYRDLVSIESKDGEWEFFCHWFYLNNLVVEFDKVFDLKPVPDQRDTVLKIIKYLNNNDYYYLNRANGLGQALLCELLSHIKVTYDNPYGEALRKVVFYINQHVYENVSVKELAEMCNICEKHFRDLFERQTGEAPKKYIMRTKLEKAVFLLENSLWSIAEISDSLSFSSPAYFIDRFKKAYNRTPMQFRADHLYRAADYEEE
ncbi:MAG TPA: hypothetical protein DDW54_02030 [Clostridiales bacterium]|nr:hypothetical protein [Clostridiales bacterium]